MVLKAHRREMVHRHPKVLSFARGGSVGRACPLFTIVLAVSLAAIVSAGTVAAADHYVGGEAGDFSSIQDALNAAGAGDTVYVRSGGIYFEDLVFNTRGVRLVAIGGEVALHGDVEINADRVRFEGFAMPEGKSITVADGINFTNPFPSNNLAVFVSASRHSDYNLVLGDVTVNIDQSGSGVQAYQLHGGTITHSGSIDVTIQAPGTIGSGLLITDVRDVDATIENVSVKAGSRATGVSLTAVGNVDLTISGSVQAEASSTARPRLGSTYEGSTVSRSTRRSVMSLPRVEGTPAGSSFTMWVAARLMGD